MDLFGKQKQFGYNIYLKPLTYINLLKKRLVVDDQMTDMMLQDAQVPCNIPLHDGYIMQLSLFQRDASRPERSPYYGIHLLDEDQEITPGCGLNFTQEEYDNLMGMLLQWKEMVKLQLDEEDGCFAEPKPSKRRREDVSIQEPGTSYGADEECGDGGHGGGEDSGAADGDHDDHDDQKRIELPPPASKKRKLALVLYGWEWVKDGEEMQFLTTGHSQGEWFVDPKECLREAMTYRQLPLNSRLETFTKKLYKTIGFDMLDACLSQMILEKIESIKEYKNEEYGDDDLEKFGEEAMKSIDMEQIFERCKKVITSYQKFTAEQNVWFMRMVSEYPKEGGILDIMKRGYLDDTFLQVFQYIV